MHHRAIALLLSIALPLAHSALAAEGSAPSAPAPPHSAALEYTSISTDGFDQSTYGLKSTIQLFRPESTDIYTRLGAEYISTDERGNFPADLYNLTVSLGARNSDIIAEVMLNSRGDRPFNSMDEVSAGLFAFYRVWPRPHGGLFAGLVYFPFERIVPEEVLPVSVPIPFLMYLHAAPDLFVMAGIPTIVRWNPAKFLFFDFQYLPSRNITAWAGARSGRAFRVGPEFAWRQRNYLIAGREDKDEKLYQDHKQVGLKLSFRPLYVIEISLFGGYLFDTRRFTGETYGDVNDERKIDDGPIANAEAKALF